MFSVTEMIKPDRSWIRRWKDKHGVITEEYKDGVDEFINVAYQNEGVASSYGEILCPCRKCKCYQWKVRYDVQKNLYYNGFLLTYTNWFFHGEERWAKETSNVDTVVGDSNNPYRDMIQDAMLEENVGETLIKEDPNSSAYKSYNLLEEADEPLWDECVK